MGTDGLFYGTSYYGGSYRYGTIFSFNPTGNILTSLASFNYDNGAYPNKSLTLGTDGLFYGTTEYGGSIPGWGTIYSFNPTGNVLTSLASFLSQSNRGTYPYTYPYGAEPSSPLTLGKDGLFYGTTNYGTILYKGYSGYGTIYSFNPTGNILTSLASFDGWLNGAFPGDPLILGKDGLFYGTTEGGGYNWSGTIFSFDPGFTASKPIPEPSALLGTTIAVALGAALTRKSGRKPKE